MPCCWRLILVLLLCVRQETELSIAVRRFVFQKDMSEYCRRRVMPSVFLGRQVVDANSQILHFERLELPYSCFISIRTESGSSIILVIQLMSDKSLVKACKENGNQLMVYEIAETFGGYWGPLPDHLMTQEPADGVSFYTMKTTLTPPPTDASYDSETERDVEQTVSTPNQSVPLQSEPKDSNEYIRMEVPIVNVSAKLVPGRMEPDAVFNIDDAFDMLYDVTPGFGMKYKSTVLPLVQFSIENAAGKRRGGVDMQWNPRYAMDYGDGFTPDTRLTIPFLGSTTNKRKTQRYNKSNVNRLLKFTKNKQLFAARDSLLRKKLSTTRRLRYTIQPYNILTKHYDFVQPPTPQKNIESVPNSWELIDDILRNLSKTNDVNIQRLGMNESTLMHRISEVDHNISVYLAPNLSAYKKVPTSTSRSITRYSVGPITWRIPSVSYETNIFNQLDEINKGNALITDATETTSITVERNTSSEVSVGTPDPSLDIDTIILKANGSTNIEIMKYKKSTLAPEALNNLTTESLKPLTGSLVDHESWENVVQSAPVMAVILNQTASHNTTPGHAPSEDNHTTTASPMYDHSKVRNKRFVYAIPIENARPHHVSTTKLQSEPTTPGYKISDAQEFAELVELQDDELQGRVSLRYLRRYVGPLLFNICDYSEATTRHVYLFNSSRLVLAISNFTMERMTVVLTPAQTLLSSEARCTGAHLECQISGTRVCIDALSACDGIPNCGSYDIYDEDRLMCGAAAGLQHNVYLAAFTFLAVLLTILYTVHYWLKRCVPKVSDAFFVYTDAAENVLYLDSIMRPPHDVDEGKLFYRHVFQEGTQSHVVSLEHRNIFVRYIRNCINFLRCKRTKKVTREDLVGELYKAFPGPPRIYSFTEMEIDRMGGKQLTDAAVQTGSSLEMKLRKKPSIYKFPVELQHVIEKPGTSKDALKSRDYKRSPQNVSLEKPFNELSMLKFFKKTRSDSLRSENSRICKVSSPPTNVPTIAEEEELRCFDLEQSVLSSLSGLIEPITLTNKIHTEKPEHVRKRLRFDEETTTIPSTSANEVLNDDQKDNPQRRSIVLGLGKLYRSQDLDAVEECNEQGSSREFKSYFWGGKSKAKKTKKKTHGSMR